MARGTVFVSREELQPVLADVKQVPGDPASYELRDGQIPPALDQLIDAKLPPTVNPKRIPCDQVLDQELLDQAAAPHT